MTCNVSCPSFKDTPMLLINFCYAWQQKYITEVRNYVLTNWNGLYILTTVRLKCLSELQKQKEKVDVCKALRVLWQRLVTQNWRLRGSKYRNELSFVCLWLTRCFQICWWYVQYVLVVCWKLSKYYFIANCLFKSYVYLYLSSSCIIFFSFSLIEIYITVTNT